MKLKVYTADGSSSQEKEFEHIPVMEGERGRAALRQFIIAHQANKRQGNACTKTRAEVSGSGKKPWRQKGTGRARAGSRRSPIFSGGGVAFGPKPRDYSQKVNRKIKLLAFQRAIFERAQKEEIVVIEKWEISEPKTRLINTVLNKVVPEGKILIVDDVLSNDMALAARNLKRVSASDATSLSAWDLVCYTKIIMSEKGINTVLVRAKGALAKDD